MRYDYMVCGNQSFYPDDVWDKCSKCDAKIVHRPHMPKDVKKICLKCTMFMNDSQPEIHMTEETKQDLREYFAKEKQ